MPLFNLSTAAPSQNLQRLLMVRSLFLVLVSAILAISYWQWQVALAYRPMIVVLSCLALVNILTHVHLRFQPQLPTSGFVAQLLIDILGITGLLYFSGGADNPFVSYYLVPLCIAAATLNWRAAWPLMLFALGCYTLLFFYRIPLPDLAPASGHSGHAGQGDSNPFSAHTIGMWFNFLMSALLITFFVVRMAESLRRKHEDLTQLKEDRLRDEQLLAVATLAAGASHELSTPLTTMKALLHEMIIDQPGQSEIRQDLILLQNQINQCADALDHLNRQAAGWSRESQSCQSLHTYCRQLIDSWLLMRPDATAKVEFDQDNPELEVRIHPSVSQSVLNILNNAADASPQGVEVNIVWNQRQLRFSIRDHGPGIDQQILQKLGNAFVSEKGEGRGLGLFLTQATLERHGGALLLDNHPDGGACAVIQLPLQDK